VWESLSTFSDLVVKLRSTHHLIALHCALNCTAVAGELALRREPELYRGMCVVGAVLFVVVLVVLVV